MWRAALYSCVRGLARRMSRFAADRRGGVAIFIGASIIPLVGVLGVATDEARGYLVKARLSQALDAAALAGGKVMLSANRDADIGMYFNANFPSGYLGAAVDGPHISANADNTKLTLTATATLDTTFMRVLGFTDMTVAANTEVTRQVDQLDLVISLDMSGSMDGASKIGAARDSAITLVNTLFGTNTTSPTLVVDGTTYYLLNIGLVTWNDKVRVTIEGQSYNSGATTSTTVPAFTNPVTGVSQTTLWYANNSPVPLLSNPSTLPGGWDGAVWARYLGDGSNTNDADDVRGQVTVGGKAWQGWEPIAIQDGEPRSGNWNSSEGPSGTRWTDNSSWRARSCNNSYINDSGSSTNFDQSNGNIAGTAPNTSRPSAVPNPKTGGSKTFAFVDPTQSYAKPNIGSNPASNDCVNAALTHGIIPLQHSKTTLTTLLNGIGNFDPNGDTIIPQGLAWAWEVLMPGVPFTEAVASVPFPRTRAIVLLTDGANQGGNGDAYKGRFGSGTGAGTNTNAAHGNITVGGASVQNNLNNRLKLVAEHVRGDGIKLFVIGFDLVGNTTALNLLQAIATPEDGNGPYFFNAPTAAALQDAFKQIASSLSKLRLSK